MVCAPIMTTTAMAITVADGTESSSLLFFFLHSHECLKCFRRLCLETPLVTIWPLDARPVKDTLEILWSSLGAKVDVNVLVVNLAG